MKKQLVVQKYGGSSLAKPEQIRAAAERIADIHHQGHAVIIVVSAMGKTTDQLVELAYQVSPEPNRRELDMLLTTGERVSMALMSMALNDRGCQAISFTGSQAGILTDDSHSNARITDVKPTRVEAELARGRVVVLAGFQGVSPITKEITTLGRGGSDTSAVALAAYFHAERCEIRKDVDGVYSADPNQVATARHLPSLHYQHLLDMTYWGAKVLHYRSVELAALLKIPLIVALAHGEGRQTRIESIGPSVNLSTSPSTSPTNIDGDSSMSEPVYEQTRILSVNSHKDVRWIRVDKAEMNGAMQTLFELLRQRQLPWPQVLDVSQTASNQWTFLVTGPQETLTAIGSLIANDPCMKMDTRALSSVTATCQGAYASHLPEDIANALSARNVPIHKMMFSAMSITAIVDATACTTAVQLIHDLRPQSEPGTGS